MVQSSCVSEFQDCLRVSFRGNGCVNTGVSLNTYSSDCQKLSCLLPSGPPALSLGVNPRMPRNLPLDPQLGSGIVEDPGPALAPTPGLDGDDPCGEPTVLGKKRILLDVERGHRVHRDRGAELAGGRIGSVQRVDHHRAAVLGSVGDDELALDRARDAGDEGEGVPQGRRALRRARDAGHRDRRRRVRVGAHFDPLGLLGVRRQNELDLRRRFHFASRFVITFSGDADPVCAGRGRGDGQRTAGSHAARKVERASEHLHARRRQGLAFVASHHNAKVPRQRGNDSQPQRDH